MDLTLEQRYANLLRGSEDNSPLVTDGYKFSMAQAGFPLRHEVFYLHYRKGDALFIPFDFKAVMEALKPRLPDARERGFLTAHGYGFTPAMDAALQGDLHVYAQPKGSWSNPQEPVVTPSGPSFLASWYEAMTIAFHFPMQIATAIINGRRQFTATCRDEKAIIELVAESLADDVFDLPNDLHIEVKTDEFLAALDDRLEDLKGALGGDIDRAFDVGTRAMTCMEHHRLVLRRCKQHGITRTANVLLAYELYMVPVGTTGHEHQERHRGDLAAFRAVRDQRPEPPSYLFDTFDPISSGIPAAIEAMLENRLRACSVRFDSGDQEAQLRLFVEAHAKGCTPLYLFMDGYDAKRVAAMERFAAGLDVKPELRHYGLGSFLVCVADEFTRNGVAMVYKLCQTGGPGNQFGGLGTPVKKYSGTPGKESIAGFPVMTVGNDGTRVIAQLGEGYEHPSGVARTVVGMAKPTSPSVFSPQTEIISNFCRKRDLGSVGATE